MKSVLVVESSSRLKNSFTRKLTKGVIKKIEEIHGEILLVTTDLGATPFPHLNESQIAAFFSDPAGFSDADRDNLALSDRSVAQLKQAEIIVISVPMYNFSIPSVLKAWIDHVVRVGQTFRYAENGPVGLLEGKKVYLVIASGGIYSEGPMQNYDFVEPYFRAVLGFMGISDITTFRVEGLAIRADQEKTLQDATQSIRI